MLKRRTLMMSAVAGGAGLLTQGAALAQAGSKWPTKPVRVVVGLAAGGLADVLARIVQPYLGESLGQPVVVDNRGGAGGNVAGVEVVRNGADGHTFLLVPSTIESVNPTMFSPMPFDPQKDLRPVALLANSQLFLFVRSTLGVDSLESFIAYAKKHPDTLTFGSAGNGTTPHLAGELLKKSAGITATHAPYRGVAPAFQDLVAGSIDFAFGPATVLPWVKQGKLKVLAVASQRRAAVLPDVRTFNEAGIKDVLADSLFGIYAPSHMKPEVIERMNREVNKVLQRPDVKTRFVEAGADAIALTPAEYAAQVQAEKRLFTEVVKSLGLKAT